MKTQTKVQEIFHLSNGSTIFIVPRQWANGASKVTCEIIINGSSIGAKELFVNLLCRPKQRLEFSAYSTTEKIIVTTEDECILKLK